MKRAAIRSSLLLALLLPAAGGWAASGEAKPAARPLDLSVPRDVVQPAAGDGPFLPGATRYGMGFEARRNLEANTSSSSPAGGAPGSPPYANAAGGGAPGRGAAAMPSTSPASSAGGPRSSGGGGGGGGGGRRR